MRRSGRFRSPASGASVADTSGGPPAMSRIAGVRILRDPVELAEALARAAACEERSMSHHRSRMTRFGAGPPARPEPADPR